MIVYYFFDKTENYNELKRFINFVVNRINDLTVSDERFLKVNQSFESI